MEQLDLVVHVPGALVTRRRRQQAASLTGTQKRLHHLIPLRIGVPQIVALINQHEIAVFVEHIFQ